MFENDREVVKNKKVYHLEIQIEIFINEMIQCLGIPIKLSGWEEGSWVVIQMKQDWPYTDYC